MEETQTAIILGIETSCDETSAAVVVNGRECLSNIIATQIPLHRRFGGVVPEIASRAHTEAVNQVAADALREAKLEFAEIDAIAVTNGPGLVGALLVGVSTAKALAFALDKPLVAVHHIDAHISANYIENKELAPPFLCLVVSGGHTQIVFCKDYGNYELIGQTLDDAAGEAFDKAARVLGLPYPGGPALDKLAKSGNPSALKLPRAKTANPFDFSFSGLKTAFIQLNRAGKLEGIPREDCAASFREAVCDALVGKTIAAAKSLRTEKLPICIAGGVAANSRLRELLGEKACEAGFPLFIPPMKLCTDNAAMVASAGYFNFISGQTCGLSLNAVPYLPL
ncbi:MAG: tRNA (adenosine(37)-N6)-threonylcarbamoyltransferase complex transferase subunit TsaD [Oscillospiraceae bacterium]|jgi:N6-L-threonylcarbamoyladenine synthase|nr:tRNA (adenosine(37)-N6)-threonylcarbamoyltransferase complex transferase subunit TsaD [Oscillospiraceae bacterium]